MLFLKKNFFLFSVLTKTHELHGKDLTVIPADPRHQPNYVKKPPNNTDEPKIKESDTSTSAEIYPLVHKISDNCLMQIFQYLPIVDRVKVERGKNQQSINNIFYLVKISISKLKK